MNPSSPKGPTTYMENKERSYNSKVKSLLYGGEAKPDTPLAQGKRPVQHRGSGAPAPFATSAAEADKQKAEYQTKPKQREGADKETKQGFDPDVYRQQIASNYTNMQASKARNYGGNGIFN